MLFRKLFQILVVGGAVIGAASGCSSPAIGQEATREKADASDGGASPEGETGKAAQGADASAAPDPSGGVLGW
jgi:hypothetical protein